MTDWFITEWDITDWAITDCVVTDWVIADSFVNDSVIALSVWTITDTKAFFSDWAITVLHADCAIIDSVFADGPSLAGHYKYPHPTHTQPPPPT